MSTSSLLSGDPGLSSPQMQAQLPKMADRSSAWNWSTSSGLEASGCFEALAFFSGVGEVGVIGVTETGCIPARFPMPAPRSTNRPRYRSCRTRSPRACGFSIPWRNPYSGPPSCLMRRLRSMKAASPLPGFFLALA